MTEERLHYRYPVSPYMGERLRGVVGQRICGGGRFLRKASFPVNRAGANGGGDSTTNLRGFHYKRRALALTRWRQSVLRLYQFWKIND